METILQKIVVKLVGATADFDRGLDKSSKTLERFSANLSSVGNKLTLGVTLPIMGMAGVATKAFGSFDEAMTRSTAIMGDMSASVVKRMKDQAIAMSRDGKASATDLADAYYFLASAGYDAESQMAALPQVAAFAAAGDFDLATATDVAADSQSALGLKSQDAAYNLKQLTRITDVLTDAANASNASVLQFGQAMTHGAGVALKSANKQLEEGAAVLSVYADKGIKAALSAEKMKALYRELELQWGKNRKEFDKLGIEVFKDGKWQNTADIVEDLEQALGGLSDETKAATLIQLGFRAEAQNAIKPLLGASEAIRKYEDRFKGLNGVTRDVARKQLESMNAALALMKNNITAVAINIGQLLSPGVFKMSQRVKAAADMWFKLSDEQKKNLVTIGSIVAALGPAAIAAAYLARTIGTLATAYNVLSVAVGRATLATWGFVRAAAVAIGVAIAPWLPVIGVVAAVGAAIAGLVYLLVGPESLSAAWQSASAAATGFAANWRQNITILSKWIVSAFKTTWDNVTKAASSAFDNIYPFYVAVARAGDRMLFTMIGAINHFFFVELPAIIYNSFIDAIKYAIKTVTSIFTEWLPWLVTSFFTTAQSIGETIKDGIWSGLKAAFEMFKRVASFGGRLFKALFTGDFIKVITEGISKAWTEFVGFFKKLGTAMYKALTWDQEWLDQLKVDYDRGADGKDLGKDFARILKEEFKGFGLGEMKPIGMPQFNLQQPMPGVHPQLPNPAVPKKGWQQGGFDADRYYGYKGRGWQQGGELDMERFAKYKAVGKPKEEMVAKGKAEFTATDMSSVEAFRQSRLSMLAGGKVAENSLAELKKIASGVKDLKDDDKKPVVKASNLKG